MKEETFRLCLRNGRDSGLWEQGEEESRDCGKGGKREDGPRVERVFLVSGAQAQVMWETLEDRDRD